MGSMLYPVQADLTIADDGKSTFTIVIPQKAPDSVEDAAKELQRSVEESTKAEIAIKKDTEAKSGNIISLGSTVQAKAAGISADGIADSGFRIVTKNNNLYIIGLDTAAKITQQPRGYGDMTPQPDIPGPQHTKDGGWSNGTANGVYTFLEDYLGVRWLMPGELGRDVPARSTFTIPDLDKKEEPRFVYRTIGSLQKYTESIPAVEEWQTRQKIGFSNRIDYNHKWWETINRGYGGDPRSGRPNTDAVRKAYEEHPEWFAMDSKGNRPFPKDHYGSIETTNQELVKFYAEQAIEALKEDPTLGTYSLSPSDGSGWSESPESKKYYDPSPTTIFDPESPPGRPSITPLILKWYHDVSKVIAKKYPEGKTAGYIYSSYLFPPRNASMKLPDNFIPVLAPSFSYGYGQYRPENREQFDYILDKWSDVFPSTWFYYDLPNWIRGQDGMVAPVAPNILNRIFSKVVEKGAKGIMLHGIPSWSSAAIKTYINAKLSWDPTLDANDIQREWLMRAYGNEAGTVMEELYTKLDKWFEEGHNKYTFLRYHVREPLFRGVFAPHYDEIESLFLKAKSQPMTDAQKARLDLIEQNLIVLRWRMVNAGYIKKDIESPLKKDGAYVANLMFDGGEPRMTEDKAFTVFPVLWYQDQPSHTMVKVTEDDAPQNLKSKLLNQGYILLYVKEAGPINLQAPAVESGSALIGWTVYEPKNKNSFRVMKRGLFYEGGNISFDANANSLYLLRITPQGFVSPKLDYTLTISNAATAKGTFGEDFLYLQKTDKPVSVFVPQGLDIYADNTAEGARLRTMTPQDAARAKELENHPDAKVLLTLDTGWKFQTDPDKVGMVQKYFSPDYDHEDWKTLKATNTWQDQGFPNYHGVAWYRKTFTLPSVPTGKVLLFFGAVDGDAVVYVNGKKVGGHKLESNGTGWDRPFSIDVTDAIQPKQNNITVQVTKYSNASGIFNGVSLLGGYLLGG